MRSTVRWNSQSILRIVDEHYRRTGAWPTHSSGRIRGDPDGRTWWSVEHHLGRWSQVGQPRSIAKFIQQWRGKRNPKNLPPLTAKKVLAWIDAHHERTGRWPIAKSGAIANSNGETWRSIDQALSLGRRSFPKGSTLARFVGLHRGVRNRRDLEPLSVSQILEWADTHSKRSGRWPTAHSGRVFGAPGESWGGLHYALRYGRRGLRTNSTLAMVLADRRGVRRRVPYEISFSRIVKWARRHHARCGAWPHQRTGRIQGEQLSWSTVDSWIRRRAAKQATRLTLAMFLGERLGAKCRRRGPLSPRRIRQWAEQWRQRTGRWPRANDGPIPEAPEETWSAVYTAMMHGTRGLPRKMRFHNGRPRGPRRPLTQDHILKCSKSFFKVTGRWPRLYDGPVRDSSGDTWAAINAALQFGLRGLPGGSSLAKFLVAHCGVRSTAVLPALSIQQVVRWADTHHSRTGRWPRIASGKIPGASGESWASIDYSMRLGKRGLPSMSLAQLLQRDRGVRPHRWGDRLTESQIVQWAKTHHARRGDWPHATSGAIVESPSRTWRSVDSALRSGLRGLKGGSTLATLLALRVGARHRMQPPDLRHAAILKWADHHYHVMGTWPSSDNGPVRGAPGENWQRIHHFLKHGGRGLPGGSSLVALLAKSRGARYRRHGLPLTEEMILKWAIAHRRKTGELPTPRSGPMRLIEGETWPAIDSALRRGARNLRGGSSLRRLLESRLGE